MMMTCTVSSFVVGGGAAATTTLLPRAPSASAGVAGGGGGVSFAATAGKGAASSVRQQGCVTRAPVVSCRANMNQEAKIALVRLATASGPILTPRILQLVDDCLPQVTRRTPLGSKSWFDQIHKTLMADLPAAAIAIRLMGECENNQVVSTNLLKKAHFLGVCVEVEDAVHLGDKDLVKIKQAELDVLLYESFDALPDPRQRLQVRQEYEAKLRKLDAEWAEKNKLKE
jgi:hypothetical protein